MLEHHKTIHKIIADVLSVTGKWENSHPPDVGSGGSLLSPRETGAAASPPVVRHGPVSWMRFQDNDP